MNKTWRNNALSLAGIFHASHQVEQIAKTGYLNSSDFETCVDSLLCVSPDTPIDVYGGSAQPIRRGIEALVRALDNRHHAENADVIRYSLAVLHLQKLMRRKNLMINTIAERLASAKSQAEHFGKTHDNVVSNLADLYTSTISTLPYRIHVTGEQNYLEQERVANQVRVMLFSGIRSATLWRQCGGRRWQLLFSRHKILNTALELMDETHPS